LDGVIDDEIDGDEGFDDFRIFFEASDRIAHGGEVDQERHAGEVLEDDAGDRERDFFSGWFLGIPAGEVLDIAGACLKAVAVAEDRLENDAERDREPGEVDFQLLAEFREALELVRFSRGGKGVQGGFAKIGHGRCEPRIKGFLEKVGRGGGD
jgi:hypothetical protein